MNTDVLKPAVLPLRKRQRNSEAPDKCKQAKPGRPGFFFALFQAGFTLPRPAFREPC